MKLVTKDGRSYVITQTDLLWLARAAQAEGGNEAATLWTWAWRFMVLRRGQGTLTDLVRGHSQPVNPLWDQASDAKCREHPTRCTAASLARRAHFATMPWDSIAKPVRDLVLAWASGQVPNPAPRATDFADATVSTSFLRRNPDAVVVLREGNWYIAERASRSLPADFVQVEHNGRLSSQATSKARTAAKYLLGAGIVYLVWSLVT